MMLPLRLLRAWAILGLLLFSVAPAFTQNTDVFTLIAASLRNGKAVELDKLGWKYQPGDDPRFADPQFDDRAWATLAASAKPQDSPSGWHGIGWFRLHLRVAPELSNVALNLEMAHLGASEVYLNGKLIKRFGVVGKTQAEETAINPNALPLLVVLQNGTEQIIAVRYSNQQVADVNSFLARWMLSGESPFGFKGIGFSSRVREFDAAASQRRMGYGAWPSPFSFLATETTAFLSFGILHLLLFAFLARQRSNLFYGLFLFGFGINTFLLILLLSAHYGPTGFYLLLAWGLGITWFPALISLVAFLYSAFTPGLPRRIWLLLAGAFLLEFWGAVWPVKYWTAPAYLLDAAVTFEMLRIIVGAIRRQLPGARIVGVGLLLLSFTLAQSLLATPNMLTYGLGLFGMILALSIYLAREYARTNENLEEQLVQVKQLSAAALEHEKVKAENERRAQELEEARQLQLSMLPKKLPSLPQLDLAAYMQTASEVGGDYYDFHLGEDGTLTIAVGDATGHGLKAGTMVTAVKSLFETLAYHPDIPHIFERLSRTLKRMNLRGLFMAMMMVKVRGHLLSLSSAGMPPVLIYRAATGAVEELLMKALPLGGMAGYQYKQVELALASGDEVVLMSDGLPERFNQAGEMLDYDVAKRGFAEVAKQSPQQIIEQLVNLGEAWADGRAQDDDVTFVVLRMK
jgi:serine phosphatase RsbU (regulator of sigma subunit)